MVLSPFRWYAEQTACIINAPAYGKSGANILNGLLLQLNLTNLFLFLNLWTNTK